MIKFRGVINGKVYTDLEEFERMYRDICSAPVQNEPVNVSYTLSSEPDNQAGASPQVSPATSTVPVENQSGLSCKKDLPPCAESEIDRLCSTAESIRRIVDETSSKLQSRIYAVEQDHHDTHELDNTIDSALMKIDWLVQSLPAETRKILCSSIYDATKEMVDKVVSGLVDTRYELAKEQELISDEIVDLREEIGELNNKMKELDSEIEKNYDEINNRQKEYDLNGSKINSIGVAKRFFDGLLDAFSM